MATMIDALKALEGQDWALSHDVATRLWPGQRFRRSPNGGPDGGQRAAAGLLGRMARRGLVSRAWKDKDPRTYYRLTHAGRAALAASDPQRGSEAQG